MLAAARRILKTGTLRCPFSRFKGLKAGSQSTIGNLTIRSNQLVNGTATFVSTVTLQSKLYANGNITGTG
jgi:hypothetical protein